MKAQMMRGAAWVAASRVLINGIGFASTLLLARILLPEDFGIVAVATTVIAIVGSVTEIPLSAALVQHSNPVRAHFDSAWTISVTRGLIIAFALALAAIPIGGLYRDERLVPLIWSLAAATFIPCLCSPMYATFTRNLIFKQDFLLGVTKKFTGFVASVLVAFIYHTYWALVIGQVVSELAALIMTYILAPYRPRFSFSRAAELLSFSIWLSFIQILMTINYRFDNLYIGYFLTNSDVGQYSYGENLALLPTREATAPIAQTLFPAFSRVRDEQDRLGSAYTRAQTLLCAIALPIGIGFAAIADPLVHIVLGDKWSPAIIVIQVLSAVTALQTLGTSLQPLAMALGETKALLRRDIAIVLVRLPLVVCGLLLGGLAGVVYARIVSGALSTVMNLTLVKQFLNISVASQIAANSRGLIASAVMVSTILLVQVLAPMPTGFIAGCGMLLLQVTLGGLVYAVTCYAIWRMRGYPAGPELEIGGAVQRIVQMLTSRRRPSSLP